MNVEEDLLKQITDALDIRHGIAEGKIVLLDAAKVQKAFDYMMAAKTTTPIKPRLSENHKLWILVGIATWGMFAAVALSIWHTF